ncbi:Signal transduction histidine kinase CheA [hydrothermal vent metagenome]|uniref:histidine kinase n=1 Tax=hydrothermal vent metagenome TaxID=652676 RepID=A0A3B0XQJ3_9ZZZZ
MKTEDTVEYNSLRWVKKELDLILQEAQTSLSAYIENTQETERLRESVEHLHMVHGTLQMVELYGAAQLAEEMEKVSDALLNGKVNKVDDAYDVLMRSMLQLPDYLESLQSGGKDVPMVLLPLLNDLRASRNASLLSENVLFFPDVDNEEAPPGVQIESGQLLGTAKKLRPHYQIGLLGWFKGEKIPASLKRIIAVLGELEKKSAQPATRRIWSISSALIEGLTQQGIDSNVSIKMLLGQVDRSIKQLIDSDEDTFAENAPSDLIKNLLYYIARIKTDSPRVRNIKTTYRLEELLPSDTELEEVRSGMGGLNAELLSTVSAGIREDLLEVKDSLEIFVHSEVQDLGRLSALPDLLLKIADTLSMLGLGMPREQVLEQKGVIKQVISGEKKTSDELILTVAGVLLSVESQLNSFIANRSSMSATGEPPRRVGDLAEMPESEYHEVLSAVIREALQDFNDARQAVLSYLENPTDKSLLDLIVRRLDEVSGAMFMLPVKKLKHQIDSVRDYVVRVMQNAAHIPAGDEQSDMADVVTSIEYYLEAIIEGRPDLELSMNSGNAAADRLNKRTDDLGTDSSAGDSAAIAKENIAQAEKKVKAVDAAAKKNAETKRSDAGTQVADENRYIVLRDDADEEILEIFIEEALEVLDSLNEQVPLWSNDHGDNDALITIRRSFHTLKGSGRLIGAELIGEFAWIFESMLNRIIEKSRPLTQDVFDALDEALAVLPQLIEQLRGNRDPIPGIYQLIDRVDLLGKWEKPAADESAAAESVPAAVEEVLETELSSYIEDEINLDFEIDAEISSTVVDREIVDLEIEDDIDPESIIEISEDELMLEDDPDIDTGELDVDDFEVGDLEIDDLSIDVVEPLTAEGDAGGDDDFDIDLTDELEALQIASTDDNEIKAEDFEGDEGDDFVEEISLDDLLLSVEASGGEAIETDVKPEHEIEVEIEAIDDAVESEDELQVHIDPILFGIFKGESENHLQHVRTMLERHEQSIEPVTANAELLRALHTLFGSARTAEVDEIAELCGALEKYIRLYIDRNDLSISDSGVKLISDVTNKVTEMLVGLEDKDQRIQSDEALLQRIKDLSEEIRLEALQSAPAEETSQGHDVGLMDEGESLVSYSDVDDELVDIFLEEAEELLDSCENSLQRWTSNNDDDEGLLDLQRHLHTLKGGARMADLSPVGNLTHSLESLVVAVGERNLPFTKDISNVLHDALDQLSDMLSKVKEREPIASADTMIANIELIRQGKEPSTPASAPASDDEGEDPEPELAYEPDETVTSDDIDIGILDDVDVIDIEGAAADDIVLDDIVLDDLMAKNFGEPAESSSLGDESVMGFEEADEGLDIGLGLTPDTQPAEVDLSATLPTESDFSLESDIIESEPDTSTLVLDKADAGHEPAEPQPKDGMANEQVRVRSDLLNDLVNHAGEVSVYHARMGQQVTNFSFNLSEMDQTVIRLREQLRQLSNETEAQILSRYEKEADQYDKDFDPLEMDRFSTMQQISRSLQETVGDIESIKEILSEEVRDSETLLLQESRVSTELQEGLMRTRMVHFGGLASRLRRIVRQTSRELGNDVELDIVGETSEVDRTVLDRIVAPLEHMLRNAVSHGIEKPEERLASGKPETGHLKVVVDREGGDVVILVSDDGRGIDVVAIRKKAIEKGLLNEDSDLSDHDVLQYIMQPGFSTAEKVTQISGRGVGMDVVDSEIKQLGGVLEIDTVQGKGTTFTIRLPLTLAINHALLVNVGDEVYAVPLNSIEGVVRLSGPELQQFYNSGERSYSFAGSEYELKHLGYILNGTQPDYSRQGQLFPVLLARAGDQSVALHVDELIGRREIVVKPVGAQISTVRGISGATILGDGRVVIILEMNALVLGDSLFHVSLGDDEAVTEEVEAVEVQREPIIMVVDDSITIRKVTERMLARHNMKVITAKDGVDAVSQLQDIRPDVMLLDIEMPRMDGYEVATHIRNDSRLKDLPIIMITSRSGAKHREKAMDIGVNKYLGKPYQEDDLLENINELLNDAR